MSALLTPPPGGRNPVPLLRWTVKQFHDLGDAGVFEGRRPFLIDGIIYEQGFINEPHAIAILLGQEVLAGIFGAGWVVRNQLPLVLGLDTDPRPDFAVVRGTPRAQRPHPTTAELVIEVADSTLDTDLTEKAELYATAGIPDYWVIDVLNRIAHVLRDPGPLATGGTAYRDTQVIDAAGTVTPLAAPTATVRVADLLP